MQTVRVRERTGKDGVLNLRIPLGQPEAEYEAVVVLQPRTASNGGPQQWPAGYFEKTFGSITDETFTRPPQGEVGKPVDLE